MSTVAIYLALAGTFFWWVILLAPWQAWRTRELLEPNERLVGADTAARAFSEVTILIPARNEAQVIAQTLDGLLAQSHDLRIIVIDDQSDDNTAALASQKGAQVISGTSPPKGWSGKLWALQQGLREAHTRYTLLLDADITLAPGTLAALLDKAQQENLSLISLMAKLSTERFFERLLIPAFIFFFKLLYPFKLANDPASRMAAAAGGCMLVETRALRAINAFASIHDALIDDCTLAKKIKLAGFKTWIGLSHAAQSHRGYNRLGEIWNMVARTAYTQLHYSLPLLLLCSMIMTSMFWFAPMSVILSSDTLFLVTGILAWLAMSVVYIPTLRFYRCSLLWVLTLPVIGTLYLMMTWTSAIRYWQGQRAQWKDRNYETPNNV
ncbi:glycosyltransferase [Nitrosomonas halophila]|jgi:hopene-associated glycosyltransferase HpnB|uniref:Hopene-associated glycosyltransferase HpnB n=1 Tax=Nitrosomonas halophila TaxID=44576 RepID=A0A1H3E5B8_9PROT|nr:glycosyltransferase [Nitrosomonas halophila]SDX73807.1 hopene-associated glycosyltransferase HpnB [Nitrosomonas halophila]